MSTLAANLNLRGREALLLGAGAVGRRKLGYLLDCGALVTVVEPQPAPWLSELAEEGRVGVVPAFSASLLDGSPIVFAAAEPGAVSGAVKAALDRGLWVNVAGSPEQGNFTLPALVEDGPFRLAVSTGGASPAFAAQVAARLRREYAGCGDFCRALSLLRPPILASQLPPSGRRELFRKLAESGELFDLLRGGRAAEAERLAARLIAPLALPPGFSLDFPQTSGDT